MELEPLTDCSATAVLEVHRQGDRYILLETAAITGNLLLRFSSKDKELVYAAYTQEVGGPL